MLSAHREAQNQHRRRGGGEERKRFIARLKISISTPFICRMQKRAVANARLRFTEEFIVKREKRIIDPRRGSRSRILVTVDAVMQP